MGGTIIKQPRCFAFFISYDLRGWHRSWYLLASPSVQGDCQFSFRCRGPLADSLLLVAIAGSMVWTVPSTSVTAPFPPRFRQNLVAVARTPGHSQLPTLSIGDAH